MTREPSEYTVKGRIQRVGPHEFVILVVVSSTDQLTPGAPFTEQGKARTREDAARCLWKMVRDISARLRNQGHRVVTVETDP